MRASLSFSTAACVCLYKSFLTDKHEPLPIYLSFSTQHINQKLSTGLEYSASFTQTVGEAKRQLVSCLLIYLLSICLQAGEKRFPDEEFICVYFIRRRGAAEETFPGFTLKR